MAVQHANDDTFETLVLRSERPVLVDFWAAWCAPCRMVAPILEEIAAETEGVLDIVKVDVDEAQRTARTYRIQSIPTLMLFKGGQPAQAVQGALPKAQLKDVLGKWVPELKGPSISVADLDRAMTAGQARVFDIRREFDYSRSHLAGSKCVAPEQLEATLTALPADTIPVLICRTGETSRAEAARLAKALGRKVLALDSGLLGWEGSGRPTYSTREEQEAAEAAKRSAS